MKKLLYILAFAVCGQIYAQQTVNLDLLVLDINGNAIPNQLVTVRDNGTTMGIIYTYTTNANGYVLDSLGVQNTGSLSAFSSLNGCTDSVVMPYNSGGPSVIYFNDTLVLCGTSGNCNFSVAASKTFPSNPNMQGSYSFTSTYPYSPGSSYLWSFGDGNTDFSPSPIHSYAQVGTYVYCLQVDSCPIVCDTIVVSSNSLCNAYIFNKPTYFDSTLTHSFGHTHLGNANTTYSWSFGDGTTSTLSHPNHTYQQAGTYYPCLTIDSCAPICDTIVVFNKKPVNVTGYLLDTLGAPLQQYPFDFNLRYFYGSTLSTNYLIGFWHVLHPNFITNNNGIYSQTIYTKVDLNMDSATVQVQPRDTCSNTTYFGPQHILPLNTSSITLVDTFQFSCSASPIPNCNFAFGANPSLLNPNAFSFWHQANVNPGTNTVWDFGDGTSSTQSSPIHTYTVPGTYIYCVTITGCPAKCDTIVISQTPTNCQASFIIDTVNSQPGAVVVWNTSTPYYSPNSLVQYSWDFGDGTTSTNPFPSHTYLGAGTYVLCLSINVPASGGIPACTSAFCDTLMVDSLGNIIQKSTGTSFTLNVLNPNAIGIDEHVATEFKLYPNPANEIININFKTYSSRSLSIEVIDLNGRLVLKENRDTQNGNNKIKMNVNDFTPGVYFVKLNLDGEIYHQKIIIQ